MPRHHVSEQITAIAAVIVALAALAFSLIENRRSEEFARLQAMPLLLVSDSLSSGVFSMTVSNETTNPAIIKWFSLAGQQGRGDERVVDELQNYDELYEWLGIEPAARTWTFGMLWPEGSLAPSDEQLLISEPDAEIASELWRQRNSFNVQVCYCSILGDCKLAQLRGHNPPLEPIDECSADPVFEAKVWIPPSFFNS